MSKKIKHTIPKRNHNKIDYNKHKNSKRRVIVSDPSVIGYWEQEEQLALLQSWAERGLNNIQIARNIGINRTTFQRWLTENENIRDIIMHEREVRATELSNKMYESAIGNQFITKQRSHKIKEITFDEKGRKIESERVIVVDEVNQVERDQKAGEFLLKNWNPEEYKDKVEVEQNQKETVRIIVDDLPHD